MESIFHWCFNLCLLKKHTGGIYSVDDFLIPPIGQGLLAVIIVLHLKGALIHSLRCTRWSAKGLNDKRAVHLKTEVGHHWLRSFLTEIIDTPILWLSLSAFKICMNSGVSKLSSTETNKSNLISMTAHPIQSFCSGATIAAANDMSHLLLQRPPFNPARRIQKLQSAVAFPEIKVKFCGVHNFT